MKKNGEIVLRKINQVHVLLPIRAIRGENCAFQLNEVGSFLWEKLDSIDSLPELAKELSQAFSVSIQRAERDVINFLEELKQEGILL